VKGQLQIWTCIGVAMPTKQSLKLTSKRSSEFSIRISTTCDHKKKDPKVQANHTMYGNELSDMDLGGMNHMNGCLNYFILSKLSSDLSRDCINHMVPECW
jgi:hypothetical protein